MNMTKQTGVMLAIVFCTVVICVTIVVALGKEPSALIAFLGSTIVPAAVALWAGNSADKAAKNAEQAVHNTNGRMTELIQHITALGGTVDPEKYSDVIPPNPEDGPGA